MKFLIRQCRIVDPSSPHHGEVTDIIIDSGKIARIGQVRDEQVDREISTGGLHVSPGWADVFSDFSDPGFEHRETLETGAAAAAAGGFTDVFVIPNTKPVTDNKSQVEYLARASHKLPVNIHPIGAVSKNTDGRELAEMYDMHNSGAIAFGDGTSPVQSAGLLLKALQYVKAFDGVVIQIPDDKSVGANGLMHEGIVSTRLGLAGKPMIAEELLVARDIKLARYTGSRLHFTGVTSPRSLEYIRRAKEGGLDVTCSATPHHLFFTDEDLLGYDTLLKVFPPLRSSQEQQALRRAVSDGTVDCIATHHTPLEYDSKVLEFEYARAGMSGLETCYPALKTCMPEISEQRWVELLSLNPRKIFGLPRAGVREGDPASLTLFNPGGTTQVHESFFRSRSKNSPFIGQTLSGEVLGVINGEKLSLSK